MAETVEELVVKATPEGIDETEDGLQGMQEQFEETADEMEETTSVLGDLQERFAGAFGAIVAGLAVAVGGLLSQVPVLGEVAAGVGAIVEAIAFQMDKVLRPVLQPFANELFKLSNAIFELDGPLGIAVGLLGSLATVLIGATVALMPLLRLVSAAKPVFTTFASGLMKVVSGLTSLITGSVTAAAAFGALLGLLGVGILEQTGVLSDIRTLGDEIGTALPGELRSFATAFIALFLGPLTLVGAAINGFVKGFLEGGLTEGLSQAVSTTMTLLSIYQQAFENTLSNIPGTKFVSFVFNAGTTGALQALSNIQEVLKDIGTKVYKITMEFVDDPLGTVVSIGSELSGLTNEAFDAVINIIMELKNQLPDVNFDTDLPSQIGGSQTGMTGAGTAPRVDPNINVDGNTMNSALSQYDTKYASDGGR